MIDNRPPDHPPVIIINSMASVNFYLKDPKSTKETPINMYFAFGNRKPLKYSTGDKISPANWSADKQRIREKRTISDCEERNAFLSKIESLVNTIHKTLLLEDIEITEAILKERLDVALSRNKKKAPKATSFLTYLDYILELKKEQKSTDVGIISMAINNLKAYCQEKKISLEFSDMTLSFRDKFNAFLNAQDYKQNSVRTCFAALRIILNEATNDKLNTNMEYLSKKFNAKSERVKKFALKEAELKAILDLDLSAYPEQWNEVRDMFLIGTYVGMRVSDYGKLTKDTIVDGMIYRKTQKTGKNVVVPIHPVVRQILQKRNGDFPPRNSTVIINTLIKKIAQLAGIKNTVIVSYTMGGKRVDEVKEKWETVTTHTARRSGATGMIKAGIDKNKVKMITGHESDEAFSVYIDIDEEENATELANHPYFQ